MGRGEPVEPRGDVCDSGLGGAQAVVAREARGEGGEEGLPHHAVGGRLAHHTRAGLAEREGRGREREGGGGCL